MRNNIILYFACGMIFSSNAELASAIAQPNIEKNKTDTLTMHGVLSDSDKNKSVLDFGAIGNGITDDTIAISKSLASSGRAYLPNKYTFLVNGLILNAGQKIHGAGTLKGIPGTTMATISGNGAIVNGIRIETNGATYAFVQTGNSSKVQNVSFSGNVGHYVIAVGDRQEISGNLFDGSSATKITTPVVFNGAKKFRAFNNRFNDTLGFGIQVRNGSYEGQITNNIFRQPQYTQKSITGSNQISFTFKLKEAVARYGIQVNGLPITAGLTIKTKDGKNFNVTFARAPQPGTVIKLIGYRALENININSRVYDVQVTQNDMDGSGDSGIVIGADYHNGILDPNNVDTKDFPARIIVKKNIVKNSGYAGIAQTHAAADCRIDDNIVQNNGKITDDFSYSSGILATGPNLSVHGNVIKNTTVPPTMKYGIVNNLYMESDGIEKPLQRYGNNTFIGVFEDHYSIKNMLHGFRRQSVTIDDAPSTSYPAQIDLNTAFLVRPANTPYFSYQAKGSGWMHDTRMGNGPSLGTIEGDYVDIALSAASMFDHHILRVDFLAKAKSGKSYFQVYTTLDGLPFPVTVNVTKPEWRAYTMYIPLTNIDINKLFIRIGSIQGTANFQDIRIAGISLDNK